MKIENQPYKVLWSTIPVIFLVILLKGQNTVTIVLHDSYYIIDSIDAGLFYSIVLVILGGIYWALRSFKLNATLSRIHSFATSILLVVITFLTIFDNLSKSANIEIVRTLTSIGVVIIPLLVFVQLLLLINVILTFFIKLRD